VTPDDLQDVRYDVSDGVATIFLHRPERGNAWTARMASDYRWALYFADHSDDVGAVVVTGSGDSFSVGADSDILVDIETADGRYSRARPELPEYADGAPAGLRHNHTYPLSMSKPVLAAINGRCAGVGFVVASFADVRYAAVGAKLTASFAGLGLPAEYGLGWILPRIVGLQTAASMLLMNSVLTSEEALEVGYVQRVWPAETLAENVRAIAVLAAREVSPDSVRTMKRQLYVDAWDDLDAAYQRSVAEMDRMLPGADFTEGVRALRQRRPPSFRAPKA
jgi:enoyl-CoA hydratase/carnithine racemase